MDNLIETTNISLWGKIKGAFFGFFVGIALFIGSFFLLSWNEGNSLKTMQANNFVRDNVISIAADEVLPANNGKLVHIVGNLFANQIQLILPKLIFRHMMDGTTSKNFLI